MGGGQGAQGVAHMEAPGHREPDRQSPLGLFKPVAHALDGAHDAVGLGAVVGVRFNAETVHRVGVSAPPFQYLRSVRVVPVDDADTGCLGPGIYKFKQPLLRGEIVVKIGVKIHVVPGEVCLLYTSPSPRDRTRSRMPSSA